MQASTIVLNVVIPLDSIQWPQAEVDASGPLTVDQRRALFASFHEVFTSRRNGARYVFTNMVLGNDPNTGVSWSEYSHNAITRHQASQVLGALAALSDTL